MDRWFLSSDVIVPQRRQFYRRVKVYFFENFAIVLDASALCLLIRWLSTICCAKISWGKRQQPAKRRLLKQGFYVVFGSFCPGSRDGRAGLDEKLSGLTVQL